LGNKWSIKDSCNLLFDELQDLCNDISMTLSQYIKKTGDAQCAKLFSVKERTVASWRRGENYPRANKAQEIVILTKGEVTLNDIFQGAI